MSKPDLAALIAQQRKKPKHRKKAAAPRVTPPPVPPQTLPARAPAQSAKPSELRRDIFIRRFITEYLRNGMMEAGPAYLIVRPHVTRETAYANASALLKCEDVQVELQRQIKDVFVKQGLNEAWVQRQWAAMASANMLDYMKFDNEGNFIGFDLNPAKLTIDQQQNIQSLRVDKGNIVHIQLVSRPDTVDRVARANKMYREIDNEDLSAIAKEITERMQRASKMLPHVRTFDNDTGEEIE